MTEPTRDISQLPMPNGFDPSLVARFLTQWGHSGHIGTRYLAHGRDWVDLAFDWREDLVGDPESGVLASSAIISLMDMACSLAIWTKLGEFRPHVTMDLRVDYLRPSPKGERVIGRGICYHITKSIGFVRGVAHNGDINSPIAHVTGTFIRVGDRVA